jgi:hypothetical protein
LRSVLKALRVPEASQTLVFSKTSFQFTKINPEHPRALYYNDDVYVGSVHQGKTIEIVSFDPMQGAIFYLLDDQKTDKPVFRRAELDCTQCHIAAATRGVPGLAALGLSGGFGVLTPRAAIYHRSEKPAERTLGRVVCQRGSGQSDDGEQGGNRAGCPARAGTVDHRL